MTGVTRSEVAVASLPSMSGAGGPCPGRSGFAAARRRCRADARAMAQSRPGPRCVRGTACPRPGARPDSCTGGRPLRHLRASSAEQGDRAPRCFLARGCSYHPPALHLHHIRFTSPHVLQVEQPRIVRVVRRRLLEESTLLSSAQTRRCLRSSSAATSSARSRPSLGSSFRAGGQFFAGTCPPASLATAPPAARAR